jgi:hypothetical protein
MTGGGDSPSSGWKSPESFSTDNHIVMSEYLLIFSTLLGISMILHYFVSHKWKIKWLPEAGSTLLLGIIAGISISCGRFDHFFRLNEFVIIVFFLRRCNENRPARIHPVIIIIIIPKRSIRCD